MKPLPLLSYIGNVVAIGVIGWLCWPASSPQAKPTATDAARAPVIAKQPAVGAAAEGTAGSWATGHTDAVVEALRRMGAPREILADVVHALLMREFLERRRAIDHPPGAPKWTSHNAVHTAATQQQIADLNRDFERETMRLLGSDYEKTMITRDDLVIMPDRLSAEKRTQVTDLYLDYAAARRNNHPSPAAQEKIEAQFENDLKQILTPDEARDYLAYNSPSASQLQQRLAGSDLNDTAYLQLYRQLSDYREAHGAESGGSYGTASFGFKAGEFQVARDAVGDALAVKVSGPDTRFSQVMPILVPTDDPAALAGKYSAYLQFMAGIEQTEKNPSAFGDPAQQRASVASAAYAKLTDDLSPTAKAEFDRSQVAMFMHHMMGK